MRRISLLLLAAMLAGCAVSYRQVQGPALSPVGETGTTAMIRVEDRGGILTKLSFNALKLALFGMAASAAVQSRVVDQQVSTEYAGNTKIITTTTTTETTFDPEKARAAESIARTDFTQREVNAPADEPSQYASLDVALRQLGGDTAGARWEFGFDSGRIAARLPLRGVRFRFGMVLANWRFDRPAVAGSNNSWFWGSAVQVEVQPIRQLRLFALYESNWLSWFVSPEYDGYGKVYYDDPSPLHLGARLGISKVFVRAEAIWSRLRSSDATFALEAGLVF